MAIYYFDAKVISRSKGQSIVACAAYRSAEKLYDERYEKLYDYERKQGVKHSETLLPEGAPAWMKEREALWNSVEKAEKRIDAQLAREVKFSLPRELNLQQNIDLTREFVKNIFVSRGMAADYSIHIEKASDGGAQPHAHVLLTQRAITEQGFGNKVRDWNKKENLLMWRKDWADYENRHLALNGHDLRVDHRTLKEQGIDLIPQDKIGYVGSRERLEAYQQYLENTRLNGEKLLAQPEIVLDVLINQQSTFTHHDIARIVDRYTVDSDQFQSVYQKVKALPQLVSLGVDAKQRERFTTKDMLQLESEMVANAVSLHGKDSHAIDDSSWNVSIDQHQLSPEQASVLKHLVAEGDLKNVIGYAGTGKSRLLGASRELWETSGYRVLGATLSGIAAQNLEASSGIESRTLASRLHAWDRGEELLGSKDILVIDEAGMIGSRQMAEITNEANKHGAKVVLMGDPEQLQAIQAGAAFRGILERTSYVELTDIWRQREAWQKDATVQLATSQTKEALLQYAAHDCIHEFNTQSQAKEALIDAWNDARISHTDQSQLMLAYTRRDVNELNLYARELRQSLGELGESHSLMTERGERQFADGERIYFLKNDRDLGVKNGTLGTIVEMNHDVLTVHIDKGDADQPHSIQFSMNQYNQLDYGYAATIHKGQGVTVDRSFLLASQYLDRHATYVAMTRHRDGADIYWSKEEFPSYDAMTSIMGRERAKDMTLDYVSAEFDKASFAVHRGIDTLWDNFWEKYGAEWLDKIRHVIAACVDHAKEYVGALQETVTKAMGLNLNDSADDAWLKEMRTWVDTQFGSEKVDHAESFNVLQQPIEQQTSKLSNEERYQKIMENDLSRKTNTLQKDSLDKEIEF